MARNRVGTCSRNCSSDIKIKLWMTSFVLFSFLYKFTSGCVVCPLHDVIENIWVCCHTIQECEHTEFILRTLLESSCLQPKQLVLEEDTVLEMLNWWADQKHKLQTAGSILSFLQNVDTWWKSSKCCFFNHCALLWFLYPICRLLCSSS
jgi:hypothetical protein